MLGRITGQSFWHVVDTLATGLAFGLIFIAFRVIMATLLVQGLTLPWLVRELGVKADTDAEHRLEHDLAIRAAKAARRRLKETEATEELPEDISERLQRGALDIGVRISPALLDEERREMMSAARHEALSARNEPGADPEVVDRVLRQLDVRSLR